jgi:hypothetical protein
MKLISNLTFDNAITQYEEKYDRKYYHGQLRELREGFEKGLDISYYTDPDFEHEQMREIRLGLEKGLDVSLYAKPAFDLFQMRQIEYGLESGVSAEVYTNSKYTSYHMKVIRLYLEQNLDVSCLLDENLHYLTVKRLEQRLLDVATHDIAPY